MIFLCLTIPILALIIFLMWRILEKAGYSGALSLLLLIPFANGIIFIVLLCVLAFGEWPSRIQPGWVAVPSVPVMPVYPQQGYYQPQQQYPQPPQQYMQQQYPQYPQPPQQYP